MRYSIEGQELTDMADELRAIYGETETIKVIEQQPIPLHEILNTNDTTDHDNFGFVFSSLSEFCPIQIDGAKHLKVIITVVQGTTNDSIQIVPGLYHTTNLFPWNSEEKIYIDKNVYKAEYIFSNTDVITIYAYLKGNTVKRSGLYAEIIALDDSGKPIPTDDFQDVEVEKEVKRTYKSSEIAEAIKGLDQPLPETALNITGSCYYRFSEDGWTWFIERYGNKITTKDITNVGYMFSNSENIKHIPFEINVKGSYVSMQYMFNGCFNLLEIPKINNIIVDTMERVFQNCKMIRYFPEDMADWFDWSYVDAMTSQYSGNRSGGFAGCCSLRSIPIDFLKHANVNSAATYTYWNYGFNNCSVLDELLNLPIPYTNSKWTSNSFGNAFNGCYRLKNLTFALQEDGTPIIMNWKSQTIDLTSYIGYCNAYIANITNYNSGIDLSKQVTDDATYQALKNDPDWFTTDIAYSRYNHDSAVATINTLPDTSAYLATAGGTNTIKFKKAAGSKTDGGAIETLTAEEIAVATAKGWTVTLA